MENEEVLQAEGPKSLLEIFTNERVLGMMGITVILTVVFLMIWDGGKTEPEKKDPEPPQVIREIIREKTVPPASKDTKEG